MKCRNCGAELDVGALFCRKCGTAVPEQPEKPKKKLALPKIDLSGLLKNKKLLMMLGAGALLLIVLAVVIVCASSCRKTERFESPDDVAQAVLTSLKKGDGKALADMAQLSAPLLGTHPEVFGEGGTPQAVMKGYYTRLAEGLQKTLTDRYGKDWRLDASLSTERVTDTSIFETNRALDIEASQFAVVSGPLTVDGEPVGTIRIVAAELDGEWRLLVVYIY